MNRGTSGGTDRNTNGDAGRDTGRDTDGGGDGGGRGARPLRCLVTGATGYIGGRLVPELLAAGHTVRCLARTPAKLRDHPWAGRAEVVRGDVTDAASVRGAMEGVDVAYYLVHSMGGGSRFEDTDREAARIFGEQARAAGVGRIVYLGGLTPRGVPEEELSAHLRSRAEVGRLLLASGVPTAVLRAAVIIGSGSASFEILRYLTERLPVMVTPRWVRTRLQPIAVRDVLRYLVGCAELPADVNRTFDIGGPEVLTYLAMMRRYAAVAGLPRRVIVPVPVLSPGLSSHWIGLITPVPRAVARPLAESLRHEVVCAEHDIARYVPDPPGGLMGLDQALHSALRRIKSAEVATRWSSASVPGAPGDPLPTDPNWAGGSLYTDVRERAVGASPDALWRVIEGIGGENGWYSFPLAWAARGWLDRLVGGVGLARGRRDAARLRAGDSLDFWRVEEIEPGRLLRLRAEMRLPGLAWLELAVGRGPSGETVYRQRALFHPHGLLGQAYWWGVSPFHAVVFGGMARNIASAAEAGAARAGRERAVSAREGSRPGGAARPAPRSWLPGSARRRGVPRR
ncbi:SDR family oxidoreductase [Streptomyces sp. DH37]|uniref:SDR family oxidoreductase n=1 Tax=Streptomyces sp. DH37 TaxID=3040122 RepID=UPI002443274E|nr:SDR family oxidoreductase [Streptomyces sp. DH37]MDG9703490.1 SDR family oxidoreductase [Streptomyces sp. DH37]